MKVIIENIEGRKVKWLLLLACQMMTSEVPVDFRSPILSVLTWYAVHTHTQYWQHASEDIHINQNFSSNCTFHFVTYFLLLLLHQDCFSIPFFLLQPCSLYHCSLLYFCNQVVCSYSCVNITQHYAISLLSLTLLQFTTLSLSDQATKL